MTRQTWTAFVSAIFFVGLAALLALLPVPYVTWTPGQPQNTLGNVGAQPLIKVSGIETFPTTGELDLTTVEVTRADSSLSLPEAVAAYWLPHRDALPRESIYAPGKSADQVNREEADMMETAQDDAVVAALRAAGQPVAELPVVSSVTVGGPSHNILLPGDLIVSVDGLSVSEVDDVGNQIRTHAVGETVTFDILRNHVASHVKVVTVTSPTQAGVPVVGITVGVGYKYAPDISFDLGQDLGGPSAGLVFALAIYDKITQGPLLGGRHVAGTGTINPSGDVGAIGGIQEKIAGADKDGATAFLVPAPNCKDLTGVRTKMTLIRVATLSGAIAAMKTLTEPGGAARTERCS